MAKRLLPFRQYSEHDVVNMFALEDASVNNKFTDSGAGDNGVFVKITSGNLDLDPVQYQTNSYLGKTDYPYVGANMYPTVTLKVAPASSSDVRPLGITLWETAKLDENEQKLLYYPQKAAENQVLLPGQAVPVATRGIFTLSSKAFDDSVGFAVGSGFKLSANAGKVTGSSPSDSAVIGSILATGFRGNNGVSFNINGSAVGDTYSGKYAIVKLGL